MASLSLGVPCGFASQALLLSNNVTFSNYLTSQGLSFLFCKTEPLGTMMDCCIHHDEDERMHFLSKHSSNKSVAQYVIADLCRSVSPEDPYEGFFQSPPPDIS